MKTFFAWVLVLSALASAHLDAGANQASGPYLFDIGWTPAEPVAGQSASFAVNVLDEKTLTPVAAERLFVRVEKGEEILFAGDLALANGSAAWSYVFPKNGDMTLRVSVESYAANAPVHVTASGLEAGLAGWAVAAGLALAISYLIFRRKS